MMDLLRLLMFVTLLVVARRWAHYRPLHARQFALSLVLITFAVWVMSVVTGLVCGLDAGADNGHRCLGHLLLVVAWIAVAMSIGVQFSRKGQSNWMSFAINCVVICAALGSCFLAASTGYMNGPNPEAQWRFRILHEVGMPFVSLALIAGWIKVLWRPSGCAESNATPNQG